MAARRTLDETRQLLLDAGLEMLRADGAAISIAGFSLIDVCRHAGLKTSGSAYKIWPNQNDFRIALLRHVLDRSSTDQPTTDMIVETFDAATGLPPLVEIIRSVAAFNASFYIGDADYHLFIAVWIAAATDPVLAEQVRGSDTETLDGFARLYEFVADIYGLEWVPPFSPQLMATTFAGLIEGLAIRERYAPESVPTDLMRPTGPDGEMQPWHLFACGVEAITEKFLRPREPVS